MVLCVFNKHGEDLQTPLQVFYHFLNMFAAFDFERYCVSIHGPVPFDTKSAPKYQGVVAEHGSCQYMDVLYPQKAIAKYSPNGLPPSWQHKVYRKTKMNILDPLMKDNNLGKSVSLLNATRFIRAVQMTRPKIDGIFQLNTEDAEWRNILMEVLGKTWKRCKPEPDLFLATLADGHQIPAYQVLAITPSPCSEGSSTGTGTYIRLPIASSAGDWDSQDSNVLKEDGLISAVYPETMARQAPDAFQSAKRGESDDEEGSSEPESNGRPGDTMRMTRAMSRTVSARDFSGLSTSPAASASSTIVSPVLCLDPRGHHRLALPSSGASTPTPESFRAVRTFLAEDNAGEGLFPYTRRWLRASCVSRATKGRRISWRETRSCSRGQWIRWCGSRQRLPLTAGVPDAAHQPIRTPQGFAPRAQRGAGQTQLGLDVGGPTSAAVRTRPAAGSPRTAVQKPPTGASLERAGTHVPDPEHLAPQDNPRAQAGLSTLQPQPVQGERPSSARSALGLRRSQAPILRGTCGPPHLPALREENEWPGPPRALVPQADPSGEGPPAKVPQGQRPRYAVRWGLPGFPRARRGPRDRACRRRLAPEAAPQHRKPSANQLPDMKNEAAWPALLAGRQGSEPPQQPEAGRPPWPVTSAATRGQFSAARTDAQPAIVSADKPDTRSSAKPEAELRTPNIGSRSLVPLRWSLHNGQASVDRSPTGVSDFDADLQSTRSALEAPQIGTRARVWGPPQAGEHLEGWWAAADNARSLRRQGVRRGPLPQEVHLFQTLQDWRLRSLEAGSTVQAADRVTGLPEELPPATSAVQESNADEGTRMRHIVRQTSFHLEDKRLSSAGPETKINPSGQGPHAASGHCCSYGGKPVFQNGWRWFKAFVRRFPNLDVSASPLAQWSASGIPDPNHLGEPLIGYRHEKLERTGPCIEPNGVATPGGIRPHLHNFIVRSCSGAAGGSSEPSPQGCELEGGGPCPPPDRLSVSPHEAKVLLNLRDAALDRSGLGRSHPKTLELDLPASLKFKRRISVTHMNPYMGPTSPGPPRPRKLRQAAWPLGWSRGTTARNSPRTL
eukprot:jgi/Botrbrau1/7622/Bobra.0159s0071.1